MRREHLSDLAAFLAVAEEGSFTRAATRLGTSQSALSHVIRRLEENVGVRLLSRTTRSVATTAAGDRLLVRLRPALQEIDAGIASLGELRDKPSGSVRITTSEHAAMTILNDAVARLLNSYPDIHVELSINAHFTDIVAEKFDAGVRLGESVERDMIAVPIGPDLRLACFASPDYLAGAQPVRIPQDLAQHRCINLRLGSAGGLYIWEFEKAGHPVNVRVNGGLIVNTSAVAIEAACAGVGIAMAFEDLVESRIADGRLVRLLEDWCPPFPGHHLYYPSRRQHSAAFTLLRDALRRS